MINLSRIKKFLIEIIMNNGKLSFNFLYFIIYYCHIKIFNEKKNSIKKLGLIKTFKWLTLMDKKFVFVITFPSSGIHYFLNVVSYYLNKEIFKKNFIKKSKNYSVLKKFKRIFNSDAEIPENIAHINKKKNFNFLLTHTHHPKFKIPYFKEKLDFSNKVIFIIRDPFSTLYSYSKKKKLKKNFDYNDLKNYVLFYNSYSELILNKKSLVVYSKNLSSRNNHLIFKKTLNYLIKDEQKLVNNKILNESINYFSLNKEKRRASKKHKKDFFKGLKNYKKFFSIQERKFIMNYLKKNLNPKIFKVLFK